jgi:hypothetical protein
VTVGRALIIGVMGPGEGATPDAEAMAHQLGQMIAANGWVTLSGGRDAGIMGAVTRGAAEAGGLTVGILPGSTAQARAAHLHLPIATGMGNARNNINVLASDLIVAFASQPSAGTISEIALALKAGKPLILLGIPAGDESFFQRLGPGQYERAEDVDQVMAWIEKKRSHLSEVFVPLRVVRGEEPVPGDS